MLIMENYKDYPCTKAFCKLNCEKTSELHIFTVRWGLKNEYIQSLLTE